MTNRKGFTLIEILIVVAIIGLLSSIILVGLGSFNARARDTQRITDLRQTEAALALFYNANQVYPPAGTWDVLTTALIGATIGVTRVSNDPIPARTYWYGVSGDAQQYVVGATLEDAGNRELLTDLDGTVFTIACADPVYCTQI
ncbi:MAG: type II secretion system protein [bacterium]|nr:type II secretion system protein [bacterium]